MHGPLAVSEYLRLALYDEKGGFYQRGGRAGREGDFLTSPEVGPLFGAVIANAIDTWWRDCGKPREFTVFEWGAGPGTLARSVLAANPEVLQHQALRWCAIERSAQQRSLHPKHPLLSSVAEVPPHTAAAGLVLANEFLDNLPFDLYQRRGQSWVELRVSNHHNQRDFILVRAAVLDASSPLTEELNSLFDVAPDGSTPDAAPDRAPDGARVVYQRAAREWLTQALGSLIAGRVVLFDYADTTPELAARGAWVRSHANHSRLGAGDWLSNPGACDITADVAIDQLELVRKADFNRSQRAFLQYFGIDELVEQGRQRWQATAHVGDLAALRGRSRMNEAKALCDPDGLGSFRVLEWLGE